MSPQSPTRIGTRRAAPEGPGRDGTDGTRGRGGWRSARALLATQAACGGPGPAVTWPLRRAAGPRGDLGEKRAHAHPSPPLQLSSPVAFLEPLLTSPSLLP